MAPKGTEMAKHFYDEDMARQQIDYLQSNAQHFLAISDEVKIGFGSFKMMDRNIRTDELKSGKQRFIDMQRQWQIKEKKVVAQDSMEEGEIDLF